MHCHIETMTGYLKDSAHKFHGDWPSFFVSGELRSDSAALMLVPYAELGIINGFDDM